MTPRSAGACSRTPKLQNLIDLRSQDEVASRQTVDLVRPDSHDHFSPRQVYVGMMAFAFCNRADRIREGQRLREIGKAENFLEMVLVDDLPGSAELFRDRAKLLAFQRRHAAAAWDTFLLRKLGRNDAASHKLRERGRIDSMPERLGTIDDDNWHIVGI